LPDHVMMYLKFSTHSYHIYLKCFCRFKRLSGHYFSFNSPLLGSNFIYQHRFELYSTHDIWK